MSTVKYEIDADWSCCRAPQKKKERLLSPQNGQNRCERHFYWIRNANKIRKWATLKDITAVAVLGRTSHIELLIGRYIILCMVTTWHKANIIRWFRDSTDWKQELPFDKLDETEQWMGLPANQSVIITPNFKCAQFREFSIWEAFITA